jgi:hypothetical protein
LRGKRFELLYRGSRDGMTPAAFHDKCDGNGPTLVLVAGQSEGQPVCVFGGYAGKSWERGPETGMFGEGIDAPDSFLFTVSNPFGDGISKLPNKMSGYFAGRAVVCHACCGPWFSFGFRVGTSFSTPTKEFQQDSSCDLMTKGCFGDPLGRGNNTFISIPKSFGIACIMNAIPNVIQTVL